MNRPYTEAKNPYNPWTIIIKGKQIKTKRFHLLSIPLIKLMFDNKSFGEDMGKWKLLGIAGGMINGFSHFGERFGTP